MGKNKPGNHMERYDYRALLMLLLIAALLRGLWLSAVMERDEGYFAYSAWLMVSEEQSSANNQFFNFPLIRLVYASLIRLSGNSILPMKLLNHALFLLSVPVFFKLGERPFGKKAAVAGTLLYVISMNIPVFEGPLAKTTALATPFMVLGVYFLVRSHFGTRGLNLAMSALSLAIAFLFRPTMGFGFFLIAADVIFSYESMSASRHARRQHLARIMLLLACVAALGVTTFLLFTHWQGIPSLAGEMAIIRLSYFLRPLLQLSYPQPVGMFVLEGLFLIPLLLVGVHSLWHRAEESKGSSRILCRVFLLWFILSFIVTVLPPMFGYFYLQVVPPLSIAGGIGLIRLAEWVKQRKGFTRAAAIVVFFTLILVSLYYQSLHFPHFNSPSLRGRWGNWTYSDVESFRKQKEIAAFISEHTSPNQTVILLSRDYGLLFLAERRGPKVLVSPDVFCLNNGNALPAPGVPLEEMELYLMNMLEGGPLKLDTRTIEFTRHEFERIVANDDFASVAALVTFPNNVEPCYNFDKPLFSEKVKDWKKSEIGGAIIFFRI